MCITKTWWRTRSARSRRSTGILDLTLTPAVAAAVEQYARQRPNGGYGPRAYRFEDHGLDARAEREKFRGYMARFGIEQESDPDWHSGGPRATATRSSAASDASRDHLIRNAVTKGRELGAPERFVRLRLGLGEAHADVLQQVAVQFGDPLTRAIAPPRRGEAVPGQQYRAEAADEPGEARATGAATISLNNKRLDTAASCHLLASGGMLLGTRISKTNCPDISNQID